MKKQITGLLICTVIAGAAPALAHERGHEMKHEMNAETHQEMSQQHAIDMEMMMKYTVMASQRALDMLSVGNGMMESGSQKKDAKMMLTGSKLVFQGIQMHQQSMSGLQMMSGTIKEHLMHAKVGDMKLSEQEMSAMEASMAMLKKEMESAHTACEQETAKISTQAGKLMNLGNELVLKGKNDKNGELMLSGNELMMTAIKLHHMLQEMHGGPQGQHGHQVVRRQMRRMMPGMDPMDNGMGTINIEEEVIIRQ